jgi:hypothetical protein
LRILTFRQSTMLDSLLLTQRTHDQRHAGRSTVSLRSFRRYSELGEHRTAAVFGDRAHAVHAAVSADADLILALAKSYSDLGMPQMSETLLSLLLTHKPAVRNTPQYGDALMFMRSVAERK